MIIILVFIKTVTFVLIILSLILTNLFTYMKQLIISAGLLLFSLQAALSQEPINCKPVHLACDHLVAPLGVDNSTPRLSWQLRDKRQGARQTAYQIIVGNDSLEVVNNQGKIWDSGKQHSEQMLVTYVGKELHPFTKYYWKV